MEQAKKYSIGKGLWKGALSVIGSTLVLITFMGLADVPLKVLIETYIFPLLGSVTIGGGFTMLLNYIKVKAKQ
jgi:threonine/homoserine/homoserine lactone efflux protein